MNEQRIKEVYSDYRNALARLHESLGEDISKSGTIIDGTIQRFEFTFELAWKLAKAVLDYKGIEADSPRSAIKESFKARLIKDGEGWIEMLKDRNKTSHLYDEKEALQIYQKIKNKYFKLLKDFENKNCSILPG